MSLPVLLSLVAEPLTGLVDTAFVARLGSESLAALGVGTVILSGIFWVFKDKTLYLSDIRLIEIGHDALTFP